LGDEAISRLSDSQIRDLVRLYQEQWWTKGRTEDDVRRMLDHTDFIFGFCEANSGQLIAFARVLSDRIYKALILDVIVDRDHRERRLGTALMQRILDHPELRSVKHFELYCLPEREAFYEKLGFTANLKVRLMRKTDANNPAISPPISGG